MKKFIWFFTLFINISCIAQHTTRDLTTKKISITDSIKIGSHPSLSANQFYSDLTSGGGGTVINNYSGGSSSNLNSIISVKDSLFGVNADGTDEATKIQTAIDYCITHEIQTLFFPKGSYTCGHQLIVQKPDNTFVTLYLLGEGGNWRAGNSGTVLHFTNTNTFGIDFNKAKGGGIRGFNIIGAFTGMPINNATQIFAMYNSTETTFTDSICRDSRHSPYAGIVIDAFTNNGIPSDPYPGLTSRYNLSPGAGNAGSTGVEISDCQISSFVVGILNSPNGQTLNAELTRIERVLFQNDIKFCVAGCQDQEKMNVINNCQAWMNTCFAFFTDIDYGRAGDAEHSTGAYGNWEISNINLAGRGRQIFKIRESGWFPVHATKIYSEGWASIGLIEGQNVSVKESEIDFPSIAEAGMQELLICNDPSTLFENVSIRYYGETVNLMPMTNVRATFRNCYFSTLPLINVQAGTAPTFQHCRSGYSDQPFADFGDVKTNQNLVNLNVIPYYGKTTFVNNFGQRASGVTEKIDVFSNDLSSLLYLNESQHTVNLTNRSFTFTAYASDQYQVNGLVGLFKSSDNSFGGYALVTGILGSSVTCDYTSVGVINGSDYYVYAYYPKLFAGTFTGDLAWTNKINNVRVDWGYSPNQFVGQVFWVPEYSTVRPLRIMSYDAGTNSFTIAVSPSITASDVPNVYFSNGTRKRFETNIDGDPSNADVIYLPKNSIYTIHPNTNQERVWKVTSGGYNKTLTPLATWVEQ